MKIRKGNIIDFEKLNWFWTEKYKTTLEKYIIRINKGIHEFWVVEYENSLIGELHIAWNSEDKEEADGIKRAYVFSYRIKSDYQGKRLGSKLMKKVLERIVENNFIEATIGVDSNELDLKRMYNHWGFNEWIKTKKIDHHDYTSDGQYKHVQPYDLLLKKFQ